MNRLGGQRVQDFLDRIRPNLPVTLRRDTGQGHTPETINAPLLFVGEIRQAQSFFETAGSAVTGFFIGNPEIGPPHVTVESVQLW